MRANANRNTLNMRRQLTDWVVSIFGIIWSVWWGFFIKDIFDSSIAATEMPIPFIRPLPYFHLPKLGFLFISSVFLSIYAVIFVKWLWEVHQTVYAKILLRRFVDFSLYVIMLVTFLVFGIFSVGLGYEVSTELIWYGSGLTILWPVTVLGTVWSIRNE